MINALGSQVVFDYEYTKGLFKGKRPDVEPPAPRWIRRIIGDHYFCKASYVDLSCSDLTDEGLHIVSGLGKLNTLWLVQTAVTDQGMKHLSRLTHLDELYLSGTKVSDPGLKHLVTLDNLRWLELSGTNVSADGVIELQVALPKCHIIHR